MCARDITIFSRCVCVIWTINARRFRMHINTFTYAACFVDRWMHQRCNGSAMAVCLSVITHCCYFYIYKRRSDYVLSERKKSRKRKNHICILWRRPDQVFTFHSVLLYQIDSSKTYSSNKTFDFCWLSIAEVTQTRLFVFAHAIFCLSCCPHFMVCLCLRVFNTDRWCGNYKRMSMYVVYYIRYFESELFIGLFSLCDWANFSNLCNYDLWYLPVIGFFFLSSSLLIHCNCI